MKLFIAGHQGMVGGALVRRFQRASGVTLLLRSRRELDLVPGAQTLACFKASHIILAAED